MIRRRVGPALLVTAVVVATWLFSGVAAFDIVRFLAYEFVFVALPGGSLLWVLRGRRSGFLLTVALGWPLGQILEILAFSATAAVRLRVLFLVYPIVVIALSALLIARRRQIPVQRKASHAPMSPPLMWTAAAALSVGLIYIAFMFLPEVPLPSTTAAVSYTPDFVFFVGLSAQVLSHWPPSSAGLSGVPLNYEWFVFFQIAAIAQVTHLAVPTVAFRLDYVPTILVIGCQLLAVGRLLGRSAWTGLAAIAVVFLLGPLDLTTDVSSGNPFFELFFFHLWASWTFAFGLTFLLALLYLISERLQSTTWRSRADIGPWVLIGLLMIGAAGAKATILPVVIAGIGLYAGVMFVATRKLIAGAFATLGLGIVIFIATFKVIYGGGVPGTVIEPFAPLARAAPIIFVTGLAGHPTVRAIALPFAYVASIGGMMLGLVGILYLFRRRHRVELKRFALPICLLIGGLVTTNLAHQVAYSELYFQDTGYVAGGVAAGAGIRLAWLDAGRSLPISRRGLALIFGASLVGLVLLVAITSLTLAHPKALEVRYLGLAALSVGVVVASAVILRARHRSTSGVLMLGLIPLLAATALTYPMALSPTAKKVLTGVTLTPIQPDPQAVWGLTPALLAALEWLQNHSSIDAVIAVSNHWVNPQKTDAREYYYSAFSERQVFVEAYDPTRFGITRGLNVTAPERNFLYRQHLNDAVFNAADTAALDILTTQYSVRYLFIDRIHGGVDPAVLQLGRVVYSNAQAAIVAVG
jgi:hypothetical protein